MQREIQNHWSIKLDNTPKNDWIEKRNQELTN